MSLNRTSLKKAGSSLPSYYGNRGLSERDSQSVARSKQRAGPNRSTKASGKLKILPEEPEDASTNSIAQHAFNESNKSYPVKSFGVVSTSRTGHNLSASKVDLIDEEDDDDDEDSSEDDDEGDETKATIAKQLDLARIPEGSMRRDARRITRKGRASLPRVTAYSTATSYRMRELTRWLQARRETHRTNVMTFDECVYTTYSYDLNDQSRSDHFNRHIANKHDVVKTADLLGIADGTDQEMMRINNTAATASIEGNEAQKQLARREEARRKRRERFAVDGMTPEVFLMEYGTIVIWGMSQQDEKRFLRELRKFEVEKLAMEDVESEDLNWYLADYSRIYNDVITLRKGSSYMTKLSLSHALAQSTKISFFEGVIDNTIDTTKDIPQSIAETGKIGLPPVDIMKQIGHLFILRMNIHLVGSIVDSPEIFWIQPDLEPLYSAARSYLEIPQRIELLNARVEVLQDMLQLLKDQVTSSHSEWLEIIVIVLILLEIVLGVATMVVDLYFA